MRAEFFNLSEGQINHVLIFRDALRPLYLMRLFTKFGGFNSSFPGEQHPILSSLSFNGISFDRPRRFRYFEMFYGFSYSIGLWSGIKLRIWHSRSRDRCWLIGRFSLLNRHYLQLPFLSDIFVWTTTNLCNRTSIKSLSYNEPQ